jgi:hypothetical protein
MKILGMGEIVAGSAAEMNAMPNRRETHQGLQGLQSERVFAQRGR